MSKKYTIKPPESLSLHTRYTKKGYNVSIFLAGSIDMGMTEDWQSEITYHLSDKNVLVINPRRDDWDSSWTQKITDSNFYQQVNWELNGLDKCDIIYMHFTEDSLSPISLLELGLYANSGKLIVYCPENFWREGNVNIVCEKYGIPYFNDYIEAKEYLTQRVVEIKENLNK